MAGRTLLAGLATLAALACGSSSTDNNPVGDITVQNNSFNPSTFSVPANSKVTWVWNSAGVSHNVTFDDGGPNSATQGSGQFERTFTATGSYPYHCTIHGVAMSGTITVT